MNSIQRHLTVTIGALCCVLWCAGSVAVYLAVRAGLVGQFDLALKSDIQALANMTEQNEAGLKFDSSGQFMPKFQREDKPDYFQLWETNGSTLYRSPSLNEDASLAQRTGTLATPRFWNVILPDGQSGRAAGIRFVPKEDEDTPRDPGSPPLER